MGRKLGMFSQALVLAAIVTSGSASADSSDQVEAAISAWSPLGVSQLGPRMTIVLNEDQVTGQIYQSVLTDGVCGPVWLKQANSSYLAGVSELVVTNRSQTQGLIFEGGVRECERFGLLPGPALRAEVNRLTHPK